MANRLLVVSCFHAITVAAFIILFYEFFPAFTLFYSTLAYFILYVFFAFFTYDFSKWCFCSGKIQPDNKAVLITGCDTGFGHELAKSLDSKGFRVFATCLFPEGPGAKELKESCSSKSHVLYMDVTKDESVDKALSFVKQNLGDSEFWAIVNNAGILEGSLAEFTPVDTFRRVIEVNSIGQVRVTKAFLPLLRKYKGRVVNVNSLAGRISTIGLLPYSISKHASVAFTECLSQEMKVWGVRVISIEPEMFRTPMCNVKSLIARRNDKDTNNEIISSYGEDFMEKMEAFLNTIIIFAWPNIRNVINAMESAIMDKYPDYVYKPRGNIFTRMFWYSSELDPFWFFEYVSLTLSKIIGLPIPKGARKN